MSAPVNRSRDSDAARALDARHGSPVGSETGNLRRLHRPSRAQNTFRVRIEDLLLPPNLPAGMDVLTLFSLVALLHKTTEDPEPVTVQREQSHWRITDGRHRAIAALIAGRIDVLAEEAA
jgi:hypothetical protein